MKNAYNFLGLLLMAACANVAMPTGGPRDKTPPELILSIPSDNQRNFNGKFLELTFNEDIKLKDPKEEILIIPSLGKNTVFTVKKKKLIIEPELEWASNTTYSINFRDGVQDITEGNPAENLRLAFSTGPTIDSLNIIGRVKDIFSEKVPSKITIALYQADTFDIFKNTPVYFTKSDIKGRFSLSNLKADSYFIYAFDDKNKNLKVDSKTEKFGFLINPTDPSSEKDSIEVAMVTVDSRPLTLTNIRHTSKTSRIRFNKQVDSLSIKGVSASQSIYSFGSDKSELIFYNSFDKADSIKTTLTATDSIGNQLDTTLYIRYGEIKSAEETFKTKEVMQQYNAPNKIYTYVLSYSKPLGIINTDSIYVKYDSLNSRPVNNNNINIDTLHNVITITVPIEDNPLYETDKESEPELIIGKGALITIEKDSIKQIVKRIKIPKEEDYGTVAIKIETQSKNYIVQLIDSDNKIIRTLTNIKTYTFKHLEPMEYRLRIILDDNKNGKWDIGNFYKTIEPEKIILFKSEEGKYSFPLRANWEYGPVLIKF